MVGIWSLFVIGPIILASHILELTVPIELQLLLSFPISFLNYRNHSHSNPFPLPTTMKLWLRKLFYRWSLFDKLLFYLQIPHYLSMNSVRTNGPTLCPFVWLPYAPESVEKLSESYVTFVCKQMPVS